MDKVFEREQISHLCPDCGALHSIKPVTESPGVTKEKVSLKSNTVTESELREEPSFVTDSPGFRAHQIETTKSSDDIVVGRPAGRPRKYSSNAERQKAYRARQ